MAALGAPPASAKTFDCEGFLGLEAEMRHLYSWALVEGGIAVRASYQADAIQLKKDGDQENADGSDHVARAIAEKLRPALHRNPRDLTQEVERRCATHKPTRSITLVYLETIDAWRRAGPPDPRGQ